MKYVSFLLLAIVAFAYSCSSDNSNEMTYELEGTWNIYEAYRDGDLTTTLEDGFFEFEDSILTTNILGSPISGKYQLSDDSFQHNSSLNATYNIEDYSRDSMELQTEIRGFDFLFRLTKASDTLSQDN